MDKQSQCKRILDYMRRVGPITRADALISCGCANLTARISDLRKDGHNIVTIRTQSINQFGDKITYGRFMLVE